ncbi:MAG: hypothetical protein QGH20_06355 [Candidatus Latescibacteria bacterium]|jgi:hypothetical protein|nr:hypothetical protein [Candidatus Latescibacterota bacterium]
MENKSDQIEPAVASAEGDGGEFLCPVCGSKASTLPLLVQRIVDDSEERFRVCSRECQSAARTAPHLQSSLFGRDIRLWSQSVQGELPLFGGDPARKPAETDE